MDPKKKEILNSFIKFYSHFGYKKTTMDDIAVDCGMSKKTIYNFFNSKEEIYSFLVKEKASEYSISMNDKLLTVTGVFKKFNILIEMIFYENYQWIKKGNNAFDFKNKYEIASTAFEQAYTELIKSMLIDGQSKNEISSGNIDINLRFIISILKEAMKLFNHSEDKSIQKHTIETVEKILK